MTLEDEFIRLEPIHDDLGLTYLRSLIKKCSWTKFDSKHIEEAISHGRFFWNVYQKAGDVLSGVIYLSYYEGFGWSLDAYRDEEVMLLLEKDYRKTMDGSYRAGALVLYYFYANKLCDMIYTMHSIRNIFATRICRRLGFKKMKPVETPFGMFEVLQHKGAVT